MSKQRYIIDLGFGIKPITSLDEFVIDFDQWVQNNTCGVCGGKGELKRAKTGEMVQCGLCDSLKNQKYWKSVWNQEEE